MSWSASKNLVSNAFKYALGIGTISKVDYSLLKVYLTDTNFYETNNHRFTGTNIYSVSDTYMNYNELKLNDLYKSYISTAYPNGISSNITPTNLILNDVLVDSYNNVTELKSEFTYEQLQNIPASSLLFSNKVKNSWITNDLEWSVTASADSSTMQYFKNEYNFNTVYNSNEYKIYNIPENYLEENIVRVSASQFILNKPYLLDNGVAGILLTYENKDKGLTGGNEIPVAFYGFGKILYSNDNYLQIDWHEDGVIKVE